MKKIKFLQILFVGLLAIGCKQEVKANFQSEVQNEQIEKYSIIGQEHNKMLNNLYFGNSLSEKAT